jgi:hypothetical protein
MRQELNKSGRFVRILNEAAGIYLYIRLLFRYSIGQTGSFSQTRRQNDQHWIMQLQSLTVPPTANAISIQRARYITVVPSRVTISNECFTARFSCCVVQNTTIT